MRRKVVLFVCTGNLCRSPMAEYIFRERYADGTGWVAESAGTAACDGMPASMSGRLALSDARIDMSEHRSRLITKEMIDRADLVVVMTEGHRADVLDVAPAAGDKVFLLRSFATKREQGRNIDDPIGLSDGTYRQTRDEIESCMPGLVAFLKELNG